jgi:hypothetical protein
MKWRVMVELTASDGTVPTHEISTGGSNENGHWRDCSNTLFRRKRRNIAGNGGYALIVGRNGRSRKRAQPPWRVGFNSQRIGKARKRDARSLRHLRLTFIRHPSSPGV